MALGRPGGGAGGGGRRALRLGPARFRQLAALLAIAAAGCGGDTGTESGAGRPQRFPGPENAVEARVERVTDGDTIRLVGLGPVRLIGVDTPEVFGGVECYGREASAFVKGLLPPGSRVRYRLGVEERDRYDRALAYVWLEDDRMLNGLLAEEGYALPLTIPPNVDYAELFVAAARRAREAVRGLWADDECATLNE